MLANRVSPPKGGSTMARSVVKAGERSTNVTSVCQLLALLPCSESTGRTAASSWPPVIVGCAVVSGPRRRTNAGVRAVVEVVLAPHDHELVLEDRRPQRGDLVLGHVGAEPQPGDLGAERPGDAADVGGRGDRHGVCSYAAGCRPGRARGIALRAAGRDRRRRPGREGGSGSTERAGEAQEIDVQARDEVYRRQRGLAGERAPIHGPLTSVARAVVPPTCTGAGRDSRRCTGTSHAFPGKQRTRRSLR